VARATCAAGQAGLAGAIDFLSMIDLFGEGDFRAAQINFEQAREMYHQCGDQWGQAEATFHLALAISRQHGPEAGQTAFEQSLDRFQQLGDTWGTGRVQGQLGYVLVQRGDFAQARVLQEQALASSHALNFKQGIADILNNLTYICWRLGRYDEAQQYCAESQTVSREYGLPRDEAQAKTSEGLLALHRHDYQLARSCFGDSLTFCQRSGDNMGLAECLAGLAVGLAELHQPDRAARLLGALQAVQETLRADATVMLPEEFDQFVIVLRDQLGAARFETLRTEGRALTIEQAVELALAQ
jgi:tetratricopeptide (TPR) repeat protein